MGEFKVRLLNAENNKPLKWTEISIFYDGFFSGHESKTTDDDGWATFWIEDDERYLAEKVFIKSKLHFKNISFEDGETYSYSVYV